LDAIVHIARVCRELDGDRCRELRFVERRRNRDAGMLVAAGLTMTVTGEEVVVAPAVSSARAVSA
jgi:hypothetical protein